MCQVHNGVSENSGTPKSSILIGFSIINHPFWITPIFGNTHKLILDPHLKLDDFVSHGDRTKGKPMAALKLLCSPPWNVNNFMSPKESRWMIHDLPT